MWNIGCAIIFLFMIIQSYWIYQMYFYFRRKTNCKKIKLSDKNLKDFNKFLNDNNFFHEGYICIPWNYTLGEEIMIHFNSYGYSRDLKGNLLDFHCSRSAPVEYEDYYEEPDYERAANYKLEVKNISKIGKVVSCHDEEFFSNYNYGNESDYKVDIWLIDGRKIELYFKCAEKI